MKEPAFPANEVDRLKALADTKLMDSLPEARFNRIVSMARELFDVPIVLITLVDRDRQWFKAKIGTFETETPRCTSFCAHTFEDDAPLVVEDALKDDRFSDNPLVTGDFGLQFYAGYPIHSQDGYALGALCLIDHRPRSFGARELNALRTFATMVEDEIRSTRSEPKPRLLENGDRFAKTLQRFGSALAKQSVSLAIASVVFAAILFAATTNFLQDLESKHLQMEAAKSEDLFNLRGRLETELNARLHLTYGLAGFVRAGPESINNDSFQAFASDLGRSLTGVRSLQLAPDGVVTYLWPQATNSPAMGHDLFADPKRREAAMKAIEMKRLWVAGPLELIQGGTALIGRAPIFVSDQQSTGTGDSESFWGFATVLVDLPKLLEKSGFDDVASDANVAIRGRNGLGMNGEVFTGSEAVFNGPHLSADVALPAGSWNVGIATTAKPGLSDIPALKLVFAFALASLVSALLYLLLRLPFRFQRAVENAKEELDESNARFKDAIESLPDGFAVFDSEDKMVRCNEKYREFFDVRNKPVPLGVSFSQLVREGLESGIYRLQDDSDAARDAFLDQRLAHHRQPRQEGMEMELASGRWIRTIECKVPSGGTVISYTDISELKQKEFELARENQRAEQANAAKSAFLATVSHELRTPMNAILGLLNLVQISGRLGAQDQEYIDTTHESAEHLLNLLNELLDLSKMESGKLELELSEFNLANIVRKTLKLSEAKAHQKNLRLIDAVHSETLLMVKGDAGRLQQILLNLLSNGIKFTNEGSVTLTVTKDNRQTGTTWVNFKVTDTGVGFTDAQAETLFAPFRQLDSTASRKHEGTGLGLAICKRLVEAMGGEIEAHGTPGQGATFEFSIPLEISLNAVSDITEQSAPEITPAALGHAPIRILIAEDSPANQIVFRAMLQDTGYVPDIVGNGLEAVEAAKSMDYELILMDIFMPEMDGLEATRKIRQSDSSGSLPIIALTANAMPGDQEKFMEAGMDDYLAKPVVKNTLIRMLNKWSNPALIF